MNAKWYISTLSIILVLIGLNQEQVKVANQQIVVQFTDVEMTSEKAQDEALATLTQKLYDLGIVDIEVTESDGSKLSIRYYSDIDALGVEELLSQDSALSLAYGDINQLPVDLPKDKLPEKCSLIVSDLHQQHDDGFGLNGKLAFELNQDYTRSSFPVVLAFNNFIVLEQDANEKVAFKMNRVVAIAIDNASNTIPEVRAGPAV